MIQRNSTSNKPRKINAMRDFPYGCGGQSSKCHRIGNGDKVVAVTSEIQQKLVGSEDRGVGVVDHRSACSVDRFKEVESVDLIMKKAGFNLASNGNVGSGKFVADKRNFSSSCGSKVKPLSSEETIKLIASQRRKKKSPYSSSNIQRKPLLSKAVQKQRNSPDKKMKSSNASGVKSNTHKPTQNIVEKRSSQLGFIPVMRRKKKTRKVLSPREKVLKALRIFKLVFEDLERDKARRRGSKTATSRVDCNTRNILKSHGMQMNDKKMIGPVPGIEVGDEFQYKSELNLIGLHFDIMGGIDYIKDMKLATSIVSSEGNDYGDRFNNEVMIYTGQGGNVTSKDHRVMEDQKLVTGNFALANSMKEKTPVRVIRGKKRWDQRGKRYVYVGLFLVEDYWQERGPQGNLLYKFKLCRVSGQPSINLKN